MKTNNNIKFLTLITAAFAVTQLAYAVELAKVNGKVITDKDVQAALGGFNEGQRRQILKDNSSRREIVSNLVEQELLIQEGEKMNLDKDSDYQSALAAFKRQYVTERMLKKVIEPKLSVEAVKSYYNNNKRNYTTDKVHVQHILVGDEKRANELLKQAKAKDADFQRLAEAHSIDPSAKSNRGDVGVVTRDSPFVQEFKDASFKGKPGDVVGPVKTQFGYHLIKVVDKKMGKTLNYDEIELKVKADLQRTLIDEYLVKLRTSAKITLDDKAISTL